MPLGKWVRRSHMSDCCKQWSTTLCQHPKPLLSGSAEPLCHLFTFSTLVSTAQGNLLSTAHLLTAAGHSLTIVGFEKQRNGTSNLLVFDPMFKPSPGIQRLIGTNFTASRPERLLKAYRRSRTYLRRHKNFEMLRLTVPPHRPTFDLHIDHLGPP